MMKLSSFRKLALRFCVLAVFSAQCHVYAASQKYEDISLANRYELRQSLTSEVGSISSFRSAKQAVDWISDQSKNLAKRIPNEETRRQWLRHGSLRATRYSLDPDLVLALIEVEGGFNRFAISHVGASGLMQVMPFCKDLIGDARDSLFDVRTNLRYGCIILKHYLDIENQNLSGVLLGITEALGRSYTPIGSLLFGVLNTVIQRRKIENFSSKSKTVIWLLIGLNIALAIWVNNALGTPWGWIPTHLSLEKLPELVDLLAASQFLLLVFTLDQLFRFSIKRFNVRKKQGQIPVIVVEAGSILIYALIGLLGFILLFDQSISTLLAASGALGLAIGYAFRDI